MNIKIALAGNPNCGKTTMFNALTGANQYVGNWPGVTVEKKEGKLKGREKMKISSLQIYRVFIRFLLIHWKKLSVVIIFLMRIQM